MRYLIAALLLVALIAEAGLNKPSFRGGRRNFIDGSPAPGGNMGLDFESVGQLTFGSGDSGNTDTNRFIEGTRSIFITTGTAASRADGTHTQTNVEARLSLFNASYPTPLNISGFEFAFWPSTSSTQTFMSVSIGTTAFSALENWEIYGIELLGYRTEQWNRFYTGVDRPRFSIISGNDISQVVVARRFTHRGSDTTSTNWYDGFRYYTGGTRQGVICLTFDDGYSNNVPHAFEYALQKKVPFTYFTTGNYIVQFGNTGAQIDSSNMNTTNQLERMHASGLVDICNHTWGHTNGTSQTVTQLIQDYQANYNWINANGWNRGYSAAHVAYPFGGHDADVKTAMTNLTFVWGRTIETDYLQAHDCDGSRVTGQYTDHNWNDWDTLQLNGTNTAIGTLTNAIDRAIAGGYMLNILAHQFTPTPSGGSNQHYPEQWTNIIDHIVLRRAQAGKNGQRQFQVVTIPVWNKLRKTHYWKTGAFAVAR